MADPSEIARFALTVSKFAHHGLMVTRSASKNELPTSRRRATSQADSATTSSCSSPPRSSEPIDWNTNETSTSSNYTPPKPSHKRSRTNSNNARETSGGGPTKRRKKEMKTPDPTLQPVPDILANELDVLFCGINPGVTSSRKGHHFSHSTNRFWPSLYAGGVTEFRLRPEDDATLPSLPIKMGLTNLCGRPSQAETDLHANEHGVGADILIKKLQDGRPRIVCFVGMGIWKAFFSYLTAAEFVPRVSTSTATKKKGAVYSPEDALMTYKLVHSRHHQGGAVNSTLDNGRTPIKREDSEAVAHDLPIVKVEVDDDEQPMRDLDDNKIAPVTETLFFVMPNTSGLVASYKAADYANFMATLKQRVLESRAGILNTSNFIEIRPSHR